MFLSGTCSKKDDLLERASIAARENTLLKQMHFDKRSGELCVGSAGLLQNSDVICENSDDLLSDSLSSKELKRQQRQALTKMKHNLLALRNENKKLQSLEVWGHHDGLCAREKDLNFICEKPILFEFDDSRQTERHLLGVIHADLRTIDALRIKENRKK